MNEFLPEDFRKKVGSEIRKKESECGRGKADSYPRYREMVGYIKGMKEALELFNTAMKNLGDDDEE